MSDEKNNNQIEDQEEGYTPASPAMRTMAWIGLCYMVILLGLSTYYYFTGTMLGNLPPLLSIPALVGAGALLVVLHRTEGRPPKTLAYGGAIAFWLLAAITLPIGLTGLMSNFGG